MEADHFAGSLQFRPNARMFISGLLGVRDNRHRLQDRPQITFTRGPVLSGRPLYSVPELSNGDRRNLKFFIGTGSHPLLQVESALLPANDDVGVENYRHLSAGALSLLRAVCRSRRHALASLSGRSVLARASAKSRPAHSFSFSGRDLAQALAKTDLPESE